MKFKVDDFIDLLGKETTDEKVKIILSRLNLMPPVLGKGKDTAWFELEEQGFDMAFKDESLINNDEYADVGDGELIFMTMFFKKIDHILLPFDIEKNDDAKIVIRKIGREAEKDHEALSRKSWLFKTELRYLMFFEFDESYAQMNRLGIVYYYGQMTWVQELLKK